MSAAGLTPRAAAIARAARDLLDTEGPDALTMRRLANGARGVGLRARDDHARTQQPVPAGRRPGRGLGGRCPRVLHAGQIVTAILPRACPDAQPRRGGRIRWSVEGFLPPAETLQTAELAGFFAMSAGSSSVSGIRVGRMLTQRGLSPDDRLT